MQVGDSIALKAERTPIVNQEESDRILQKSETGFNQVVAVSSEQPIQRASKIYKTVTQVDYHWPIEPLDTLLQRTLQGTTRDGRVVSQPREQGAYGLTDKQKHEDVL